MAMRPALAGAWRGQWWFQHGRYLRVRNSCGLCTGISTDANHSRGMEQAWWSGAGKRTQLMGSTFVQARGGSALGADLAAAPSTLSRRTATPLRTAACELTSPAGTEPVHLKRKKEPFTWETEYRRGQRALTSMPIIFKKQKQNTFFGGEKKT